ncbi:MAG: ABC transporter ATP-binding protein [Syntrophomonadaceae bacterium]|jgi:zinc transport system ATP-binding protein|nr:ABC transporter ATP-binding protein [Syntrophomonadaceae bacterium]NLX01056.1 ABC transporter ATP-binding protein [Syntrophomonadaceae bacterium]
MGKPVIEIKNLFVDLDGVTVLEHVNLTVNEYDFLGIIGPNGGGKTTLLRVLLGLVKPVRGKVRIMGESVEKNRHLLGYVPQYAVFDRSFPISVGEVVISARLARKQGRRFSREDYKIADAALERVEMLPLRSRQMGELSGGERQRVLVARALAAQPRILLLDEPTASVDSRFAAGFYELLQELNQEMTLILVSHDISAVSTYVKTLACLNRTLFYENSRELSQEMIENTYHCPVDLIAHGIPHRVLPPHNGVVGS